MDDPKGVADIEDVGKKSATEVSRVGKDSSSERDMALSSDNSDRQFSHSDRKHHKNSGEQRFSDPDGHYLSNLDKHNNNGHSRKRKRCEVDSNITTKNSSRAHRRSHKSTEEEDPLAKSPTATESDIGDFCDKSLSRPEKDETEDGEILEEGELDDNKEAAGSIPADQIKVSTFKSSSKKVNKGGKSERRKSRNQGNRNHENDKKKKKSHADEGHFQVEKNQGPSWGSGYQMSNRTEQGYSRGSKSRHSAPGLYYSPPEDSDEELATKTLMTGYIDASVAADEKQGIFNRKTSLGKPKKPTYEKNERKRGPKAANSFEGPPKKKSLLDMQMSERPACKFYMEGKCAKGAMCPFNHDVEQPKKMEVCKYHLTFKGCTREKCQFMHQDFPCKYYHTGTKCYSGDRCKFSHDPLTEATRKALEMRVAAEDIVDMEDPTTISEQRLREANNKPSLLGSPPQQRPELRKIPSLLDIEVHMPGHSPKPPPPQIVRPSGFYNDTTENSVPGPINNVGLMKNVIASNQLLNQRGNSGLGLLPMPVRPGNINGFMGRNIIGNQQGVNPQQPRFGMGPSVAVKTNELPQNGHMSPVLNMLGAIMREAATQKGTYSPSNMGGNSPGLNSASSDHNKMASENIASNTKSLESVNTGFVKAENNVAGNGEMAPSENTSQDKELESNVQLNQLVNKNALSGQQNLLEKSCKIEIDDTEESQDICELDKIRQQLQAQIDEEEQNEVAEDEEQKSQRQEKPADIQEKEGLSIDNTVLDKKLNNVEIPTHLPKTQQELFKRIQQQQLVRETDLEKQKINIKAEEREAKDADNWYSSDEDEEVETKPLPTLVLTNLNQAPTSHTSGSSALEIHNAHPAETKTVPSAASTFNIMQMINAIKVQGMLSKPVMGNTETSSQPVKLSLPSDNLQRPDAVMSPASPPTVSTTIMKSFGMLHNVSNCQPPPQAADPPVVSAVPSAPLTYVAVRISLDMPKPYTQLLDSVVADPAFKDDPRVKWHLSCLIKQPPKEPHGESSSEERSQKQSGAQFIKELSDPRLTRQSDSNISDRIEGTVSSDPRLHRTEPHTSPGDPRLARLANGNLDPRLNRQIIQNQNGNDNFNIRGGAMAVNSVNMGSCIKGPMNNMTPVQNMGAPAGLISGHLGNNMGNLLLNVHTRLMQGNNGLPDMMANNVNMLGRPMNKTGGEMGQISSLNMMRATQEPLFGLGGSRMRISPENTMGDALNLSLHTDPSLFGLAMHNSSDPRFRGQKVLNEMQGNSDPRLQHRSMDPRDQQQRSMDPRNLHQRSVDPRDQQQRSIDPREQQQRSMDPRNLHQRPVDPRDQQQRSLNPRDQHQRSIDPREQQQRSMDPRNLHQRSVDPRDLCFNINDSSLFRVSPNSDTVISAIEVPADLRHPMHTNNFRPFVNSLQQQREISQSLNIVQSNTTSFTHKNPEVSCGREGLSSDTDNKTQGDGLLPFPSTVASFVPRSNIDDSSFPKLDHRSDPRFRRVKKVAGQEKDSVEYSSPLGDDRNMDVAGASGRSDSDHNSYNRSRFGRDPCVRAVPSPPLPDKLRDFSLPVSPSVNVTGPVVQVKHLFKTIDPTASPFC